MSNVQLIAEIGDHRAEETPMFDVTQVGSWPRSETLLRALHARQKGDLTRSEFDEVANGEVRRCVAAQVDAGVDIVVDGEQRRDSFVSFVTEKLDGTKLMSLEETADDKKAFEEMLKAADVKPGTIRNPACIGKLSRRDPLGVDEFKFVRSLTDLPVKIALPGPYLLIRTMWGPKVSKKAYAKPTDMADDVVGILRDELVELRDAGCEFVQFDEPVLTEVVHSGKTQEGESFSRTFM
jgi:5-methyltetrahydropteroyltriglutamate--homocysteine methyltransferase